MKVDGSLGSLLQGVSQQPPRDRFDGQCTLQENMSANPVHGLMRRPPTDLVGSLGTVTTDRGWHYFQARDGRKFVVNFRDNAVQAYDLNCIVQTMVNDADAVAYLNGTTAIRCVTDDKDNTVVVNPTVKTAMVASAPAYDNTGAVSAAILQVLGGEFGRTYSININGVQVAYYRTPAGGNPDDPYWSATTLIAQQLVFALTNTYGPASPPGYSESPGSPALYGVAACAGWHIRQADDVIYIKSPTGSFTLTVGDGGGGVNFKACQTSVTKISDLPRYAPHYYAVRIAEHTEASKDTWYKFIASDIDTTTLPDITAFGRAGYWREAVAPNTNTSFDAATMPHKLTYNGTWFTFSREAYTPRGVGSDDSNAQPSFVGNTINDVSMFASRIVFLSAANVCMSRTNLYTNFWKGSTTALVDTDRIDVNSTVDSSQMISAVQFNKDLVMFTRKAQHVIFGRTALTPANATMVLTTRFESEPGAKPVSAGRNVFFASNFGRFTGIREFFAESTAELNDSRPITQHVNEYIVGKAKQLTVSANYETLLVNTSDGGTQLYIYQYIWADDKKVQSAWSTWKFAHEIVYSFFDEHLLYLVQKIGTEYFLLRMSLDVQDNDGVGYPVYLDQRFDVYGCYEQFVLPYSFLRNDRLVCVQGAGCPNPGLVVGIKSITNVPGTGWVVSLKRDMEGGHIVVGSRYLSKYMPTMQQVKDQNGVVIGTAKQTVKHFITSMSETGYAAAKASSKWGEGPEVEFTARFVGDVDNVVGEQPISDEKFVVPFRQDISRAELEYYSDSHLPMTLIDIEYVGQYNKRGRRIANSHGGN